MAAHGALVFLADGLGAADVDGDAGRPLAAGEVGHRENTRRSPAITVETVCSKTRLLLVARDDRIARHRAEEFLAVAHRFAAVQGFDGIRIGAVDPFQPPVGRAQPERHLQGVDQAEHGVMVGGEPLVFELEPCLRAQVLRKAGEADNDMDGGLAALHLERHAGIGFDRQVERHGLFAQREHGIVERCRRARHQPAAEGEEGGAIVRRAGLGRQRADQFRRSAGRSPRRSAAGRAD